MNLINNHNDALLFQCFILDETRSFLLRFHGFKCVFSSRVTNQESDVFAQEGFFSKSTSIWLENGPLLLSKVLDDDVSGSLS